MSLRAMVGEFFRESQRTARAAARRHAVCGMRHVVSRESSKERLPGTHRFLVRENRVQAKSLYFERTRLQDCRGLKNELAEAPFTIN